MPLAPSVARVPGVMRLAVLVVTCVVSAVACGSSVEVEPSSSNVPAVETTPSGFDRRIGLVSKPAGDEVAMCLWVADTPETRAIGMMGSSSFGDADAMVFVSDAPTSGRFWMWNTLIDLSIAFFDESGTFLDSRSMEVCRATDSADCPRYDTPIGYLSAVETVAGDLDRLSLVVGSRLILTDEACSSSLVPQ